MVEAEVPLTGGNVAAAVVRVGCTVRKPATPATPAVVAVLRHLERVGFRGAPRTLGRDDQGRQVLEYVEGPLADTGPPMTLAELARVGHLVAELHEALASFPPPPDATWEVAIPPDAEHLPAFIERHTRAMYDLLVDGARTGRQPWARLHDEGHARSWGAAAAYVARHADTFARALAQPVTDGKTGGDPW